MVFYGGVMKKIKIMAVDDEREQIDNLKRFFGNYNIVGYSDPRQALNELENNYYDIVITDYKMPELTGFDLLRKAKNKNAYLFGILITAYAEKSILDDFSEKNLINKFIEKPLRLRELKVILDEMVEKCEVNQCS